MEALKRYWFKFEKLPMPSPLNLGCGVTAYGYEDALALLKEKAFKGREPPEIVQIVENVDISTLDKNHVLPNMGSVVLRGVWFPIYG